MINIKSIIIFSFMSLLATSIMARTVEIKMSQCPKPYVDNLKSKAAGMGPADELILNFDKAGKYEFDGSLKLRCNTTIKGLGPNATKVIVKEGFAQGKSKMTDDVFIAVHGQSSRRVKVQIRDIAFELASHKGILWEKAAKHIVKVWHGDGVVVDNIVMKTRDAAMTNLDLRECDNVLVTNSEFENYNNCSNSGCLWSRGSQNNIVVRNNIFSKYGNDEALAFWGGVSNSSKKTELKNIVVDGNQFYYGNKTKTKADVKIDVLICFYHFKEDVYNMKNPCDVDNIVFKNNSITIDGVMSRDLAFFFDNLANVGKIEVRDNTITNTRKASSASNYMSDITIDACGNINQPVVVNGNSVINKGEILCDGKKNGYTFLSLKDADVIVNDNDLDSYYGMGLLWCHGGNAEIALNGNSVNGLEKTATLSSNTSIDNISITANGNTFTGDTHISCRNVKNMKLVFKNNVFNSSGYHLFLQEAADQTSVTFDDNTINSLSGNGVFYTNYSKKNFRFDDVSIGGNTFVGVKKQDIVNQFKQARKLKVDGNYYR